MHNNGLTFVVCARMGDPLFQVGRARTIWAAQTAQAVHDLTGGCLLVGSGQTLPFSVRNPTEARALNRLVSTMYNVDANFRIMPLYGRRPKKGERVVHGKTEAEEIFPRYVMPNARAVHTREPRIVRECVRGAVPVIYEDHNEDYHLSIDPEEIGLNSPTVKAVVAITEAVADRLVLMGVSRSKIIVQDSGVNERAFERYNDRAKRWRKSMLWRRHHKTLAVYSGGMQEERGISHILEAAQELPNTLFVMAGGNESDVNHWKMTARRKNLQNTKFFGYLPQDQVIELQQAADLLLMTRASGHRGSITSPLKFFEYLASGTPVVGVRSEAVKGKHADGCAIVWYDPDRPDSIITSIGNALNQFPRRPSGYRRNIKSAQKFTWRVRQEEILRFAGFDELLAGGSHE